MKLAITRAWYVLQAGLGVLVTATWLNQFVRTFAPDTVGRFADAPDRGLWQAAADDAQDAELRDLGVMADRCPFTADDQPLDDPNVRHCGLPAGHSGDEHPSLIERPANTPSWD